MTLDKFMAILDPTHDQQPAYDRAVESCHLTGARLHIYGCLGTTQLLPYSTMGQSDSGWDATVWAAAKT